MPECNAVPSYTYEMRKKAYFSGILIESVRRVARDQSSSRPHEKYARVLQYGPACSWHVVKDD